MSLQLSCLFLNGGPPADLLINQGVRDNVSGHITRAPPGRVRTDNQTVSNYSLENNQE